MFYLKIEPLGTSSAAYRFAHTAGHDRPWATKAPLPCSRFDCDIRAKTSGIVPLPAALLWPACRFKQAIRRGVTRNPEFQHRFNALCSTDQQSAIRKARTRKRFGSAAETWTPRVGRDKHPSFYGAIIFLLQRPPRSQVLPRPAR